MAGLVHLGRDLVVGHGAHGPEVVDAVRHLDIEGLGISPDGCDQLGIRHDIHVFLEHLRDLVDGVVDIGHGLHQGGDPVAQKILHFRKGHGSVLQDIVQDAGGDHVVVHLYVRQNGGHGKRMADVWLAGLSSDPVVAAFGNGEGGVQKARIGLRIGPDPDEQVGELLSVDSDLFRLEGPFTFLYHRAHLPYSPPSGRKPLTKWYQSSSSLEEILTTRNRLCSTVPLIMEAI